MSFPQKPALAKLVIGLFTKEKRLFDDTVRTLSERFGPVDMISVWFSFDYTTYYEPEMGSPLFRRLVVFKSLIEQNELSDIKLLTNELEIKYSTDGNRRVNIDPGYMLLERFVLATGKNFTHRIYIGKGIYADLTLVYQKGGFQKLPWTYPDYADTPLIAFLKQVRNKYAWDLKEFGKNQ